MDTKPDPSHIAYQACNMFNKKPAEIKGAFSMYSHDRFSSLIIQGIAKSLIEQGCTEEQVKWVLAHKAIRRMLDGEEDTLIEFGAQLAKEHALVDVAKEYKEQS